jgi:hypothetical protein
LWKFGYGFSRSVVFEASVSKEVDPLMPLRARRLCLVSGRTRVLVALAACCLPAAGIKAQSSATYKIDVRVLNAGGHPAAGTVLTSASYTITPDAIGDALAPTGLSSASFSVRGGTGAAHRPPGELAGLDFITKTTLNWLVEPSAGTYNVYRGGLGAILPSGFGGCQQYALPSPMASDVDAVPPGGGFFYLVTVTNFLAEEGTKGYSSNAVERPNNAPCP